MLNKKEKKDLMTKEEAEIKIDEWLDLLESPFDQDDRKDVKIELSKAIMKGRLSFDEEKEIFKYKLLKPLTRADGTVECSIIEIEEGTLGQKKDFSKEKDEIEAMIKLAKAYCKKDNGSEIETGFIMRIKDRDLKIIRVIVFSFFVQAIPQVESK
jgi:hypothetical protein